jgi:Flp pilus assembly protein TadG
MFGWLKSRLARFRRREDGAATVEFVIVFPIFMVIFVSVFESGLLMTKMVMLDRALDLTVRQIRLATGSGAITHDAVKEMICANTVIIDDCANSLQVEMVQINAANWTMPNTTADCVDRESEIAPVLNFTPGGENSIMFVRACLIVEPMFPNYGLGLILTKDPSGGVRLLANSAFASEPL